MCSIKLRYKIQRTGYLFTMEAFITYVWVQTLCHMSLDCLEKPYQIGRENVIRLYWVLGNVAVWDKEQTAEFDGTRIFLWNTIRCLEVYT